MLESRQGLSRESRKRGGSLRSMASAGAGMKVPSDSSLETASAAPPPLAARMAWWSRPAGNKGMRRHRFVEPQRVHAGPRGRVHPNIARHALLHHAPLSPYEPSLLHSTWHPVSVVRVPGRPRQNYISHFLIPLRGGASTDASLSSIPSW